MSFMNKMKGVAGKGVVAFGLAASAFTMAASPALADDTQDHVVTATVEELGRTTSGESVCSFSVEMMSVDSFKEMANKGEKLDNKYIVLKDNGPVLPLVGNNTSTPGHVDNLVEMAKVSKGYAETAQNAYSEVGLSPLVGGGPCDNYMNPPKR